MTAPEVFDQARAWLADSDTHHKHCSQSKLPVLPNSILDVSLDNAPGFIKFMETNDLRGRYAALTYCYRGGGEIGRLSLPTQVTTTSQNKVTFDQVVMSGLVIPR
jgi:hypothetical protein